MITNKNLLFIKVLLVTILVAVLIMGIFIFNGNKKIEVATIGNEKVYESDLVEFLLKKYGKNALNELISKRLIKLEAKENRVSASSEEIKLESEIMKLQRDSRYDISIPENNEYIAERVIVKKLIRGKISEENLKEFFNENKLHHENSYKISIYESKSKNETETIVDKINTGQMKSDEVKNKMEKIGDNTYKESEKLFGIHFEGAIVGEAYYVVDKNKELVVFIEEVVSGALLDFEKDREDIVDAYLNTNYTNEYINYINSLHSKYAISLTERF